MRVEGFGFEANEEQRRFVKPFLIYRLKNFQGVGVKVYGSRSMGLRL